MKRCEIPMVATSLMGLGFLMGLEASPARADFTFGTPTNLGSAVNTSAHDEEPYISPDGLSLYFCSLRPGGYGDFDLWVTSRLTTEDDWGPPVNLGPTVNSSSADFTPELSVDGLTLYFVSDRPGGHGSYDLWATRRATRQDDWGTPVNLGPTVNKAGMDGCMTISDNGLELYFWSDRPGGSGSSDIWVAERATVKEAWGAPVNLGPTVNSSAIELCSDLSPDGLCLVFVSTRSGGYGGTYGDIWMTRRATTSDPWRPPVNLGPLVNTSASEPGPALSADGSTLYFGSDRPGGFGGRDIWQVSIAPTVDFNGDGKVDIKDLLRLIESWRKYDPAVDIGPTPLGDGVVDEKDLEVLMSYWGQEIPDPALLAHWKLDEASGLVAPDSVGTNPGTLLGHPTWQPGSGKIGGALRLDGVDDYMETPFVLNPAAGPFSVFAWVKGGSGGQAIVSQAGGAHWLTVTSEGALMTELRQSGRQGKPLTSAAVITDGAWHRVGLVWDGTNRILYVDGMEVSQDTQTGLANALGGLYLGAGGTLAPGTFWSGLIDDVRIYDRAVKP